MPKAITGGLSSHLAQEVSTLATLWKVTRTDNQVFTFTDHDKDLEFPTGSGIIYESAVGYNRTSVESRVGLSVDNLDVSGFFDSGSITESELRAGLFDFADIRVSIVNWSDLTQGELKMRRGRLGEVKYSDNGTFSTELRGMSQAYSQNVVELYQPECRADLGDSRCKVALFADLVTRNTAYAVGDRVRATPLLDNVPIPALLVPGDTDADDISGNSATGTLGSQAVVQTVEKKFGVGAIEFSPSGSVDPSNAFVSYPDLGAYTIGSNEFTIECWVRFKDLTDTFQVFASHYINTGDDRAWYLARNVGNLRFFVSDDGTGAAPAVSIDGAFSWAINTWYHVAVTRDSSNDVRLYVDGTQVGSTTSVTFAVHNSAEPVRLGKFRSAGFDDGPLYGFIDDFRFLVGYAAYTGASFTIPSAAHPSPVSIISGLTISDYEDRVYVCTTAGTTDAAVQPSYDTVVGNTTTDGTAVFTAEESFTKAGVVSAVTDNRVFNVTFPNGADTRVVLDWFKFGGLNWETGNNAGLAMEVKDSLLTVISSTSTIDVDDTNTFSRATGSFITDGFVQGQKIITTNFTNGANNGTFTVQTVNALTLDIVETTLVAESGTGDETMTVNDEFNLFLSMPFVVQVGDTFSVYAGCDKRIITCRDKFDNIVNMRAEPFVAGQDAILQIHVPGQSGAISGSGTIQDKIDQLAN